jgi:hypothetical protein
LIKLQIFKLPKWVYGFLIFRFLEKLTELARFFNEVLIGSEQLERCLIFKLSGLIYNYILVNPPMDDGYSYITKSRKKPKKQTNSM